MSVMEINETVVNKRFLRHKSNCSRLQLMTSCDTNAFVRHGSQRQMWLKLTRDCDVVFVGKFINHVAYQREGKQQRAYFEERSVEICSLHNAGKECSSPFKLCLVVLCFSYFWMKRKKIKVHSHAVCCSSTT